MRERGSSKSMKKTELYIKLLGEPALRRKARPVESVTERHRKVLAEIVRLMRGVRGIGLAAPQVGINECLIVVDTGSGLYKLINPRITEKEGEQA